VTGATTAVADDDGDGDEHTLDRVPCRCGALADLLVAEIDDVVSVAVRCRCGSFAVPGTGERA
jgi:hypothetical protein